MNKLKWITPENLGIVEEGSYFKIQLTAKGDSPEIFYALISGILPEGVAVSDSGVLSGVPNTSVIGKSEIDTIINFIVRAWDGSGVIADKAFSFIVSAVASVGIIPELEFLGTFLDGDKFSHQINLEMFGQGRSTTCRFISGRLPAGITINQTGLISGYLGNKNSNLALGQYGWDKTAWDSNLLDPVRPQSGSVYEFIIEVDDGIYQNRKFYKLEVLPRDYVVHADRNYQIPYDFKVDASQNGHLPIILEESKTLPHIQINLSRQETNFAFKFNSIDLDGDDIYYEITSPDFGGFDQDGEVAFDQDVFDSSNFPMPRGLGIDNQTGWYTGRLHKQDQIKVNHTFQVYARKPWARDHSGPKINFNLSILGDFENEIQWLTDSDLGSINNGDYSILKIKAIASSNSKLIYKLKSSITSRTPQGLVLLPSGELSGRVSFRYFSLDGDKLTLDKNKTTFDRRFSFTVIAKDNAGRHYNERVFSLTVNVVHKFPHDTLYLRAMPTKNQRRFLRSIIESEYYFPSQLIYRQNDPYWGKRTYLEFLFLTGLYPGDLTTYLPAIAKNHYTKTFVFGDVKTAIAIDENFNILYEVVYLEVVDSQLGIDPKTGVKKYPEQNIRLSKVSNFYSIGGISQTTLSPNGLGNMSTQIVSQIPINKSSSLPIWMTCMQPNSKSISGFDPPLGYTPAVILAYTEPGGSKKISYRLKSGNIPFNNIEFTTDRYLLDNVLSKNYDTSTKSFISGIPCYFDQNPSVAETYRVKNDIDWVLTCDFSDISNKSIFSLREKNFFDGGNVFRPGDKVVFVQKSKFILNQNYSSGWVDSTNRNKVIPGFLNYILTGENNERSAIYEISIIDFRVRLNILELTRPGDIVNVKKGKVYGGKKVFFDSYQPLGIDPTWHEFKNNLIKDPLSGLDLIKNRSETTFDSGATRFISNRDQYYIDPNIEDKYIKFPKTGVFI